MLSSTSAWLFFVLLNAYYGGALTMFFTSEIPIPFNTIEQVMDAYPTWKLKMMGIVLYKVSRATFFGHKH